MPGSHGSVTKAGKVRMINEDGAWNKVPYWKRNKNKRKKLDPIRANRKKFKKRNPDLWKYLKDNHQI